MKTILLTNDDGYLSEGIQSLKKHLSPHYNVFIAAPDKERSAISMSISIHTPIRMKQINETDFAVSGTPCDCVTLALKQILPCRPDFILSGMNLGENLGEDVFFSGTVAGAFIANVYGIPAMAVSLTGKRGVNGNNRYNFDEGARITLNLLNKLLPLQNNNVVYNVNIPNPTSGEIVPTTVGTKGYKPTVVNKIDPRDQQYYWIGAGAPDAKRVPGTDIHAVENGLVSLSVLKYDLNCVEEKEKLAEVIHEN